jgi:hypothetical protein
MRENKLNLITLTSHRLSRYKDKAAWSAIILLLVLPAVISFIFIKTNGVNVCFWDQWNFVPLLDKLHNGQLTFMDLFIQHNEHRIFFPRLVMLLLGSITHYNNIAEMYLSWFLVCIIAFILFRAYVGTFGATKGAMVKFIPVVWLIFSLRQFENLLWGFQVQFFMAVLFFLLALYLLTTSKTIGLRFAASVISGIVCTFSLATGLLVWPIGLIQIWLGWRVQGNESRYTYRKRIIIWCLAGILAFSAYFIGYKIPSHHPSLLSFLQDPISAINYFLVCLGNPLAIEQYMAIGIGILLLSPYIYVIFHIFTKRGTTSISRMSLPVSLILFTLLSVVLLTLGRSGFGVEQAMASRYTTLTVLGIIGIYLMVLQLKSRYEKVRPFLMGFMISLIALGIVVPYTYTMIVDGKSFRDSRNKAAYYLSTFEIQSDDNLKILYGVPQVVRVGAGILKKYGLNVFSRPVLESDKLPFAEGTTLFSVDSINDSPLNQSSLAVIIDSQNKTTMTISGWAVDQKVEKVAGGVFISIDGQKDIPAMYGGDRYDVAKFFKNDSLRYSGYTASFGTSVFTTGQHVISLKVVTADGKAYYSPKWSITVDVK